jgi:hypothetical protein
MPIMTVPKAKDTVDQHDGTMSAPKGEFGNLVREADQSQESPPDITSELNVEGLTSLIIQVSTQSAGQIDGLIAELHEVRNFLRNEGKRIQREISEYAQMNQSAMASTNIISDALGPWKSFTGEKQPSPPRLVLAHPHTRQRAVETKEKL